MKAIVLTITLLCLACCGISTQARQLRQYVVYIPQQGKLRPAHGDRHNNRHALLQQHAPSSSTIVDNTMPELWQTLTHVSGTTENETDTYA